MMNFWLPLLLSLSLGGCVLKGTDSGNPGAVPSPVNSTLCSDETKAECGQDNPAVYLIDQGFCQSLDRCGSLLRSANCRIRALDSNVLPDFYGDPTSFTSRDYAIRIAEGQIVTDAARLRSCVQQMTDNACSQLPAVTDTGDQNFRITLRALLDANADCIGVFR